ncbi:MAG: DUF2306 domain-containing protein [Granulosicoccaceae bacterium]
MPRSKIAFYGMVFSSVLIALGSFRFAFLDLNIAFPGMVAHIANSPEMFLVHVVLASIALALGTLQFFTAVRRRWPAVHRWLGRLYAVGVLLGGVAGFWIAFGSSGGPVAAAGFALLAICWIVITAIAVNHIWRGRVAEHRRWMIRSFALTFAGVSLRLQLLGFGFAGVGYDEASVVLAWSCWVPNLLMVEWWFRREVL